MVRASKSRNRLRHVEAQARLKALREQANMVGHGLSGMVTTAGAAATDQLEPVEEYVRANPLRSLFIAAGVGALLGLVLIRR